MSEYIVTEIDRNKMNNIYTVIFATQELEAYLLGSTPALATHQPIYEAAWRERCRLVTISTGQISIDLCVVTRFMKGQGVDIK